MPTRAKQTKLPIDPDKATPNPTLYREMLEPHPSRESVRAAVGGFYDDVQAARKKHRIREVAVVIEYAYLAEDGQEVTNMGTLSVGDSLKAEYLYAVGLGEARARREKAISAYMRLAGE